MINLMTNPRVTEKEALKKLDIQRRNSLHRKQICKEIFPRVFPRSQSSYDPLFMFHLGHPNKTLEIVRGEKKNPKSHEKIENVFIIEESLWT